MDCLVITLLDGSTFYTRYVDFRKKKIAFYGIDRVRRTLKIKHVKYISQSFYSL